MRYRLRAFLGPRYTGRLCDGQTRRRNLLFEKLEPRALLTTVSSDFNGDGFSDLAVGGPSEGLPEGAELNGKTAAGAVNVIYGSAGGLKSKGNQFWTQDSPGINGVANSYEQFGKVLASGDFNGDGIADLAIAAPSDRFGAYPVAGSVNVLYGSAAGLSAKNDQLWNLDSPGINGRPRHGFGSALAVGDFNGDGTDDLAIGSPTMEVGGVSAGAVSIIFGSKKGLSARNDQLWHQGVDGINGINEDGDRFGSALSAADFNGDGVDDLAVSAPDEGNGLGKVPGAVHVLYGSTGSGIYRNVSAGGLSHHGDQLFRLGGAALATGDFNGDHFADLATSARGYGIVDGHSVDGKVYVLFGGRDEIDTSKTRSYTAVDLNISTFYYGTVGVSLTAGDFDCDGRDDLAIATRRFADGNYWNLGKVLVLPGSSTGPDPSAMQEWSREVDGILGGLSFFQQLGSTLLVGDYDGDGHSDLAVGNSQDAEHFVSGATQYSSGTMQVIYGSQAGLTVANNQLWSQDSPGIFDESELSDNFGSALG